MNKFYQHFINRLKHNLMYYSSLDFFISLIVNYSKVLASLIVFGGFYFVVLVNRSYIELLIILVYFLVSLVVYYNINYSDNLFIKIIQYFISNIVIFIISFVLVFIVLCIVGY